MLQPLLLTTNHRYFSRLLKWRNVPHHWVGQLPKIDGFDDYNSLIDINAAFSTCPSGEPVDRTGTVLAPMNFRTLRPWQIPTFCPDINNVFESRVKFYTEQNCTLDLFWSGGADSTAMVVAFLKHSSNLDQLRLVYSPHSLYENRDFFEFVIKSYPKLDNIDISGEVYLNAKFDNVIITGHGGDEFTASLDETFFNQVGADGLLRPWQDFVWEKNQNDRLIDFCKSYFANAGRPIDTVLEARWWFYAATKSQVFGPRVMSLLIDQSSPSIDRIGSFYDCSEFESYMWHNIDKIIELGGEYKTYKKFLRRYIYEFYKDINYLENTAKINSLQLPIYLNKKTELLDLGWIFMLEDATVVRTKNLPLLSKKEFDNTHGDRYEYLFNTPSQASCSVA